MTTLPDQPLYRTLSAGRRAQGMTQSQLARQIGCKQSAISMMERGQEGALAWGKIEAIAALLNVSIEGACPAPTLPEAPPRGTRRYCPTFDCPANTPYAVNGALYALPRDRGTGLDPAAKHCGYCGELLESHCPACGTEANAGACCTTCGSAYVATPDTLPNGAEAWAQAQRQRLAELGIGPKPH